MRSRWLIRQPGGALARTLGLYTRDEVVRLLCVTPVRRIKWWEPVTTALRKTWRRVVLSWK